jgi:hypothetical protein
MAAAGRVAKNNQENIGFSEADIFRLARTRTAH